MRPLILSGLLASMVMAQGILDSASFGHKQGQAISPNRYAIPAWHISGTVIPQILSDKIILTPPYPGNQQGAAWTDASVPDNHWNVDLEFRATGPEHGGGNFQIWYTKQSQGHIGSNSLYTIGRFEGLVLSIDMHGGRGGGIRGFLNDGTTDFHSHHHLEALAFAHCDYSYRNLGRPTKLQLKQDSSGLEVLVDGRRCFATDAVLLPANYYFGITAASSDTPDSFEVFKFVTSIPPAHIDRDHLSQKIIPREGGKADAETIKLLDDVLASSLKSQDMQFADLHNRLQVTGHQIENLFHELSRLTGMIQGRMEELHHELPKAEQVRSLESRIGALEHTVETLRNEFHQKDWTPHFNDVHSSLKARTDNLIADLPDRLAHAVHRRLPNMIVFICLIGAFQIILLGAYMVYKRRVVNAPKKYL